MEHHSVNIRILTNNFNSVQCIQDIMQRSAKTLINVAFMLATMGSSIALVVLLSKDMTDNRNDVLYLCRNLNASCITAGVCFSSRMVITILAFGCAQIIAEIFYSSRCPTCKAQIITG